MMAAGRRGLEAFGPVRRTLAIPAFQFLLVLPAAAVVTLVLLSTAVGLDHPAVNFGTVFTWVVWWEGLLGSLLLLGRAWCLVCPLGALGEWIQRTSLWWRAARAAGLDRPWPRRLRTFWLPTLLFVAFVFLDNGYGLSNSPRLTAALIVAIALGAAWVNLVFERRAFCRYLCPVTAFIGLGALTAAFELRARELDVCRSRCTSKDCFRGNDRRYGCPMGEFPGGGMDSNLHCILCTECVRSCPHGNITLRFRAPARDLWAMRRARPDGAFGAAVVVGLATVVPLLTLALLPATRRALVAGLPAGIPPNDPPRLVAVAALLALGLGASVGLVWGAAALGRQAAGDGRLTTRALFNRYAFALLPVGLVRWLADLLDHAVRTWGAIPDVTRALLVDFPWNRVTVGRVTVTHLVSPTALYVGQAALLLAGLVLSLVVMARISRRLEVEPQAALATVLPMSAVALVLTLAGLWTLAAGLL
jgi:polyferredoxin